MRLAPFACLGSVEIANVSRVTTYGQCVFFDGGCVCPALEEEVYVSPELDPAPWYDAATPESAEFQGFLPESITLSPPGSASSIALVGQGSSVSPYKLPGRVIDVTGWMVATTQAGMYWGERWLTEALRGNLCSDCRGDELKVLPFCREDDGLSPDYSGDFRTLVGTSLVDGPRWTEVSDDPSSFVVSTQFQLISRMPYLFGVPETVLDVSSFDSADPSVCGNVEAGEWSESTSIITIEAETAAVDIVIEGTRSSDGTCPGLGEPCFRAVVPALPEGGIITIDGRRREVRYYDPSSKVETSGLAYLDLDVPFTFPDVPACGNLCLCVEMGSGLVHVTVDKVERHL